MANWAYTTLAAALASGDSWSEGDVVLTADAAFIKWSSVLENGGLLPVFPLGAGCGIVTSVERLGGFAGGQHPVDDAGMEAYALVEPVTVDTTTPGVTRVVTGTSGIYALKPGVDIDRDASTWHATMCVMEGMTFVGGASKYMNVQAWAPQSLGSWTRQYVAFNSNQTYVRTGYTKIYDLGHVETDWTGHLMSAVTSSEQSFWVCAGHGAGSIMMPNTSPAYEFHLARDGGEGRANSFRYPDNNVSSGQYYGSNKFTWVSNANATRPVSGGLYIGTTSYTCDVSMRGYGVYKLRMKDIKGRNNQGVW